MKFLRVSVLCGMILVGICACGNTDGSKQEAETVKTEEQSTEIEKEPEIIDVANLLTKMGAKIRGVGTDTITIDGVDHLSGTFHEIIPDRIEAGTYRLVFSGTVLLWRCNVSVVVNGVTYNLSAKPAEDYNGYYVETEFKPGDTITVACDAVNDLTVTAILEPVSE